MINNFWFKYKMKPLNLVKLQVKFFKTHLANLLQIKINVFLKDDNLKTIDEKLTLVWLSKQVGCANRNMRKMLDRKHSAKTYESI